MVVCNSSSGFMPSVLALWVLHSIGLLVQIIGIIIAGKKAHPNTGAGGGDLLVAHTLFGPLVVNIHAIAEDPLEEIKVLWWFHPCVRSN
jgi:hypothetical protein